MTRGEPGTGSSARGSDGSRSWSGSAQNGWMPLVLVIVVGHGAVMNLFLGTMAATYLNAAHLLVVVVLELFARVRVCVDRRELCIRYGYLGWLRQRVALSRIGAARSFRLEPMEHGGWGYRGSLRFFGRAAVVVRGGPALGLELDVGRQLAITVDDAESAARLINALIAQPTAPPAHSAGSGLAPG
jgi:hypothetical protein